MPVQGISWSGVLLRLVFAIMLVLATYNPSGFSFYHWITAPPTGITALKAFAAVLLAIGWLGCLRTAYVALGMVGVLLVVALLATFVWLLVDMQFLQATGATALTWIGLVIFGFVLGIGFSWSLVRARATGKSRRSDRGDALGSAAPERVHGDERLRMGPLERVPRIEIRPRIAVREHFGELLAHCVAGFKE